MAFPSATTYVYTLTNSDTGAPIADADVWVTSDRAGHTVLASGRTDQLGQVTFYLDAGTVYLWRQKSGWNFDNPDVEEIAASDDWTAPLTVTVAIPISGDWADAATAKTDIEVAAGMVFPAALDMFVALWEGAADPDDFAVLHAGGAGAPEWVAHNGLACAFTSAPSSGTAYIVPMIVQP